MRLQEYETSRWERYLNDVKIDCPEVDGECMVENGIEDSAELVDCWL